MQLQDSYYLTFTQVSANGVGVGLAQHHQLAGFSVPRHDFPAAQQGLRDFRRDNRWQIFRPAPPQQSGDWGQLHLDRRVSRSAALGQPPLPGALPAGHWDSARVGAGAAPIRTPEGWLAIYHGANGKHRYCLGALLLDLKQPWKVLARSREPIMEPIADYETTGFFGNVVFTNGHLVNGDEVTLYYGASDSVICGARLSIAEILAHSPLMAAMQKVLHEYRHFLSYPRDMRILLITNLVYALGPAGDRDVRGRVRDAQIARRQNGRHLPVGGLYRHSRSLSSSTVSCCNASASSAFTPRACCSAGFPWP